MSNDDSKRGRVADALQQSRNRLDQTTLVGKYLGASLYSNVVSMLLGGVFMASLFHGCAVRDDLDRYDARIKRVDTDIRVINQHIIDLKAGVESCQVRDASSYIPR